MNEIKIPKGTATSFESAVEVDAEGSARISISYAGEPSRGERENALARALAEAQMIAEKAGYSAESFRSKLERWKKLVAENKIPYGKTEDGILLSYVWVPGYAGDDASVSDYVRKVNEGISRIRDAQMRSGRIACPRCGDLPFEYEVDASRVRGLCRGACGFRFSNFHDIPAKSWDRKPYA